MDAIQLNVKIRNGMRIFLDLIREYERERKSAICYDERDSLEFVDIFMDSEDSFDFIEIINLLTQNKQSITKK